jgi:hypothetical protein
MPYLQTRMMGRSEKFSHGVLPFTAAKECGLGLDISGRGIVKPGYEVFFPRTPPKGYRPALPEVTVR